MILLSYKTRTLKQKGPIDCNMSFRTLYANTRLQLRGFIVCGSILRKTVQKSQHLIGTGVNGKLSHDSFTDEAGK